MASHSFRFIPHENMRRMLVEAYDVITLTQSWAWLRAYPTNMGFMNINDIRLNYIQKILGSPHNNVSFAIIMAHMDYMAKHGWSAYAYRFRHG